MSALLKADNRPSNNLYGGGSSTALKGVPAKLHQTFHQLTNYYLSYAIGMHGTLQRKPLETAPSS